MKKITISIIMCVAILVLSSCANTVVPNNTEDPIEDSSDCPAEVSAVMLSLSNALPSTPEGAEQIQLEFNLNLLKELSKSDENVFFSSLSINQALTMAYFGAQNNTQTEMQEAMGYDGMEIADVAAYQKALIESFKNSGDTTFNNANSIWVDDGFSVYESYMIL